VSGLRPTISSSSLLFFSAESFGGILSSPGLIGI
jgi:hypothetical protein